MRQRKSAKPNPYARPDSFTKKAKAQGYPARSVFKLEEIDKRCQLFRAGQKVLDLGCAPGSWLLYAAERIGFSGLVRGVDLQPVAISLPRNASAIVGDALDTEGTTMSFLREGGPYDVVMSDMAPNTSGNRFADQARSEELVRRTLDVAEILLKPGGHWIAKFFMSDALADIRSRVRSLFEEERIIRPESTRTVSVEVFLIGLRRKPLTEQL